MAGAAGSKAPDSFKDALNSAMQAIVAGYAAPDADLQFGGMLIQAMGQFIKQGGKPQGQSPGGGGPSTGGSPGGPPPGGPSGPGDSPSPDAGSPPPGVSGPAGMSGGSPVNSAMMNQSGPGAPTMGGLSKGLTPNPDELRRVLADVAGK